MAIAAEVQERIEKEAVALTQQDYLRPGSSMVKFLGEQSGLLGQAEEDGAELAAAGLDPSRIAYFRGLFEALSLAHGQRVGASPIAPNQRAEYNAEVAQAEMDRKRMSIVATHIAEQCGDPTVTRNLRNINKGSGTVDELVDVIGFSALIRKYPELASQIKPGGVAVDTKYLDKAQARALKVLQMRGITVENGVPRNSAVDRQNRLLTLSILAQREIRKYANAAFFDRPDYYRSNYATTTTRGVVADEVQPVEADDAAMPQAS